jgi:hypothetical protein
MAKKQRTNQDLASGDLNELVNLLLAASIQQPLIPRPTFELSLNYLKKPKITTQPMTYSSISLVRNTIPASSKHS